jgi:hypothetical protein
MPGNCYFAKIIEKLIFLKHHRENVHTGISRKYAHHYVSRSMQADNKQNCGQTRTAEIIAVAILRMCLKYV